MAMAKEIMGGGFSAGQAQALGGQSQTLAALGTTNLTAAPVTSSNTIVSGADGTVGVILPAGQVGDEIWLYNNAASTLKVYPNVGGKIVITGTGLGTTDAAVSLLTFKAGIFKMQASLQWFNVMV